MCVAQWTCDCYARGSLSQQQNVLEGAESLRLSPLSQTCGDLLQMTSCWQVFAAAVTCGNDGGRVTRTAVDLPSDSQSGTSKIDLTVRCDVRVRVLQIHEAIG